MTEDPLHAQCVRHLAGMLPARAAEALQRVASHVVAARHGNTLHGICHAAHGYSQTARGNLLGADRGRGARIDEVLELGELEPGHARIERLVRLGPEDGRKERGLDAAEEDIGIGDGRGSAAPVARGTRIGAGRSGPDAKSRAVEADDGAAAGRDGVNVHHRRPHAHARDLGLEDALVFSGEMADVGRRTAHVEADHATVSRGPRAHGHADDAAAGPERMASLP